MVRIAGKGDISELAGLFKELHEYHVSLKPKSFRMPSDDYFVGRITEMMNDDNLTLFIHCGGRIDGYAEVRIIDVNTEEKIPRRMCYIDCFAVSEGSRRQGVGTELFKSVKVFAQESKCDTVQLGVTAVNSGAIEFYKKMGLAPRTIQMELYL